MQISQSAFRCNDIIVKIIYNKEIRGKKIYVEDEIKIKLEDNLENAFNAYKRRKKIHNIHNVQNEYYLFNSTIKDYVILSGKEEIYQLGLKSGDTILISNKFFYNEFIYNFKNLDNKKKKN